jgi:microcystin-dependent protein
VSENSFDPKKTGQDFSKWEPPGTTPVVANIFEVTDEFVQQLKTRLELLGLQVSASNITGGGSSSLGVPTGTMLDWPTAVAPTGYLICNGAAVEQLDYPTLFGVLGTTWDTFRGAAAPGASQFRVPDWRGLVRVAAAAAGTFATIAASGGAETHTLTSAELAAHLHAGGSLSASVASPVVTSFLTGNVAGAGPGSVVTSVGTSTQTGAVTGNTANSGTGNAHNNLQPYGVMGAVIIKT